MISFRTWFSSFEQDVHAVYSFTFQVLGPQQYTVDNKYTLSN